MKQAKLSLTPREALKSACECYGTQTEMGNMLGVKQPTVWRWLNGISPLPAKVVLKIEADTGISRHWLDPITYPFNYPSSEQVCSSIRSQSCIQDNDKVRFYGVDQRTNTPGSNCDRG